MESVEFQKVKAVLLGDSGVGKSALAARLATNAFEYTESTHGAIVRSLPVEPGEVLHRAEIMLWDLAGQADYNLVHQLFLADARIAILVVDAGSDDLDMTVSRWQPLLASHQWDMRLLVAARCDVGWIPAERFHRIANAHGFDGFFQTSSMTGQGISELRIALQSGVQWEKLPLVITSPSFAAIRRGFRDLKADGLLFVTGDQILRKAFAGGRLGTAEVLTAAHRLEMEGEVYVITPRQDTIVILLQPELLTAYGSALLLAARSNQEKPGVFEEAKALRGEFDIFQRQRVSWPDERLLLEAVVSLFVAHGLCQRDKGLLIFPDATAKPVDCFISYNSADASIAIQIGERLLDQGMNPWLDKWEVLAGESITDSIESGIERASAFLIIMSPNSMRADWVRDELKIALQKRHTDKDFIIIPVLLTQCPIPAFLRDYKYVDWREGKDEALQQILNALRGRRPRPSR